MIYIVDFFMFNTHKHVAFIKSRFLKPNENAKVRR